MSVRARDARGPIDVLTGQIAVECRLVLTVTCPVCGAVNRKLLDAGDHPELAGDRLWSLRCHGVRYVAHVLRAQFLEAQQRVAVISTHYGLSLSWLAAADRHFYPGALGDTIISLPHRSAHTVTRQVTHQPSTAPVSASSCARNEERPRPLGSRNAPTHPLRLVKSSLPSSSSSRRNGPAPTLEALSRSATEAEANGGGTSDAPATVNAERREP